MQHFYTLNEAAKLLNIDRSTLRNWLKRANITPKTSPIDGRALALSEKQLARLAAIRAPYQTKATPQIPANSPKYPSNIEQQNTIATPRTPRSQKKRNAKKLKNPDDSDSEIESELPTGYIGWREWARIHQIPETTVQKARNAGRLPALEGKWKVGRVFIEHALDADCQLEAYKLWHERERFTACPNCPNHHGK